MRAWSTAINAGNDEQAAALFAPGAIVVQGSQVTLATHADAVHWNSGLPCAGHIESVAVEGEQATAVFVLGEAASPRWPRRTGVPTHRPLWR